MKKVSLLFMMLILGVSLHAQNSVSVTNIINACTGQANGSAVLKMTTTNTGPYSFTVSGAAFTYTSASITSKTDSIIGLSAGLYNFSTSDGASTYVGNFNVNTANIPIVASISNATVCSGGSSALLASCNGTLGSNCSYYASASQTFLAIGTNTQVNTSTTFPCVYGNWYKNSRHQILINANELTALGYSQGVIKSIAFKVLSLSSTTANALPNFSIKMKAVSQPSLAYAFDNTGFTQVYTSSSYLPVVGINTHHFQNYFYWNGTSDLLIDICFTPTTLYTLNPIMESTSTNGIVKMIVIYSDATSLCSSTLAPVTWIPPTRPNILLGFGTNTVTNALNYTWLPNQFLNTNLISNPSISNATASIVYTVTANTVNNCSNSSTVSLQVATCLSVDEKNSLSQASIFPNPANNQLFIKSDKPITNIELYDITGKSLFKLIPSDSLNFVVDLKTISPGIYFVRLMDNTGHSAIKKLSVVK